MRQKALIAVLLVIAFALPEFAGAQGCSMCKAVVESGESSGNVFGGDQSIGRGLNMGILYLMVCPMCSSSCSSARRSWASVKEFAGAQG
ncbi:MAG: hypothetical protein IPO56_08160 [Flavobacteriales bacterium]|nr:hypothetical protein [Flavobacteriales bacterium]